jgi:outer membrane lipoprotein-sorting protein
MWYAETDIAESKRFYVSDGETVWYCSELQNKIREVKKWDLKKLDKESHNLALFVLLCQGLTSITFIHNPDSSPWKDLGKGKPFENQLKRLGEVKLDGKPAILFKVQTEEKRFFFHVWFGKEDGILRKQVMFDRDKVYNLVSNVTRAERIKMDSTRFQFKPPKDAKIVDSSNALIEELMKRKKGLE